MTRGRAWIGVLGVLLAGIVALNVITLSFAASTGKIYQSIEALEQDSSIVAQPRRAEIRDSTDPPRGGRAGPGDALGQSGSLSDRQLRTTSKSRPSASPPPAAAEAGRAMRLIERRIGLLFAGFLFCFLVIVGRAFWLQGVEGSKLASEAISQQTDVVTVPGLRGSILDRYGNELGRLRRCGDDLRDPVSGKGPAANRCEAGADPRHQQGPGPAFPDRTLRLFLRCPRGRAYRQRRGSPGSSCRGSGSFPTAAEPTRRGNWQGR